MSYALAHRLVSDWMERLPFQIVYYLTSEDVDALVEAIYRALGREHGESR